MILQKNTAFWKIQGHFLEIIYFKNVITFFLFAFIKNYE